MIRDSHYQPSALHDVVGLILIVITIIAIYICLDGYGPEIKAWLEAMQS
jgi:hypothetical protein